MQENEGDTFEVEDACRMSSSVNFSTTVLSSCGIDRRHLLSALRNCLFLPLGKKAAYDGIDCIPDAGGYFRSLCKGATWAEAEVYAPFYNYQNRRFHARVTHTIFYKLYITNASERFFAKQKTIRNNSEKKLLLHTNCDSCIISQW